MLTLFETLHPLITAAEVKEGLPSRALYAEGQARVGDPDVSAASRATSINLLSFRDAKRSKADAATRRSGPELRCAANAWMEGFRALIDADGARSVFRWASAPEVAPGASATPAPPALRPILAPACWERLDHWPQAEAIILRAGFSLGRSQPVTSIHIRDANGEITSIEDDALAREIQAAVDDVLIAAWRELKPIMLGSGSLSAGWIIPRVSAHERMVAHRRFAAPTPVG